MAYKYIGPQGSGGGGSFTAGGDLTGSSTNQTVAKIGGVTISSASPTDGYVLTYESASSTIKLKKSTGSGVSVTGTGLLKASSGTVAGAASLLLNADVDPTAAIAYSKLSLGTSILNSDINAAAAIAGTKIAPNFGSQNLVTTGTASFGSTPATGGTLNLPNGSLLSFRNNTNTGDVVGFQSSGNTLNIGAVANPGPLQIVAPSGSSTTMVIGGSNVAVFGASSTTHANPIALGGGVTAASGLLRVANNPGNVVSVRNSGNTSDLVMLSANTSELVIGGDTSFTTANQFGTIRMYAQTTGSLVLGLGNSNYQLFDPTNGIRFTTNVSHGGSPTYGGGNVVTFFANANTIPSTNPTAGVVAYVDAADGYFKTRTASGQVIALNGAVGGGSSFTAGGDLTGTSTSQTVAKINGATVPAAGSLTTGHVLQASGASATSYGFIADANVSASAAIAGSKVNPNFGSQLVTTSGNIRADGYIGAGTGVYATQGLIRLPASATQNGLYYRDNANTKNLPGVVTDSTDGLYIGLDPTYTNYAATIRIAGNGYLTLGSTSVAVALIHQTEGLRLPALPLFFGSGGLPTTGKIRTQNNPGPMMTQRNVGGTADQTLLAYGVNDGYLGCDSTFTAPVSQLWIGPAPVNLKNSVTKQLGTNFDNYDVVAEAQTTNATPATVYTYTIPSGRAIVADIRVSARNTSTGASEGWRGSGTWQNVAGTVTAIGTPAITKDGASAWTVAFAISGSTVQINITGAASTSLNWSVQGSFLEQR